MKVEQKAHELVMADAKANPDPPVKCVNNSKSVWKAVCRTGTELWLDTGDAEAARCEWDPCFKALTTNNSLLNREVQKGTYDALIRSTAQDLRQSDPDLDKDTLLLEIGFVLNARHGLRLARMFGGYVSVELHTDLANQVDRSVAYGKRLHAICPEHFYIKVPFSPAGLIAARRLGRAGVPVNLTLGFSVRQNDLAARFARPRFVNVFMGRLNAFVEKSGLGSGAMVGEKATLATQQVISILRESKQTSSRLIGASMRDRSQVAALAGVDVLTLPPTVAEAYREKPEKKLESRVGHAADCHVALLAGFTTSDFNGASLWDLDEPISAAIAALMNRNLDMLTPDDLIEHFHQLGLADFMPIWSGDEIDTILADGKIPNFRRWAQPLRTGKVGLDALMNMSALGAFVTDQKALDDHVLEVL